MKTFPLPVGETLGTARSSCFRGVAVQRNPAETALTARGAGSPLVNRFVSSKPPHSGPDESDDVTTPQRREEARL